MRKSPKKVEKVKRIVDHILIGVRKGYDTPYMARRLNKYGIWTLRSRSWTANSLQMQLLKMHRMESGSTLAQGLSEAIQAGDATQDDLNLLAGRIEMLH
jgi:hypothetical protein